MNTSTYTDSAKADGLTSDSLVQFPQPKTSARPHIPFAWKVKASPSASLLESFYHASNGVIAGLKSQRNLRIHSCAAVVAIALGVFFKIETYSWLALVLSIGLVLTAEFANTALEHVVDLVTGYTYQPLAKAAKDAAAGAVLVAAGMALLIGCIVFLPHLSQLLHQFAR